MEERKQNPRPVRIDSVSSRAEETEIGFRNSRRPRHLHWKQGEKPYSIADFKVIRKIGQGSFSEIFLACERKSKFLCAMKKLKKSYLWENDLVDVIVWEMKIHYVLKHPNIIDLYGWFDDRDYVYLLYEYCCEGDLHAVMKSRAGCCEEIDMQECSYLMSQVCEAVAAMHEEKIIHRDIKQKNVLLTMGNVAKLGDLGWSASFSSQNLRETHCGTPHYLPPEFSAENCRSSTSADFWALGLLSYELLTGEVPFKINLTNGKREVAFEQIDFDCFEDQSARDFTEKLLQTHNSNRMSLKKILEHPFLALCDELYF